MSEIRISLPSIPALVAQGAVFDQDRRYRYVVARQVGPRLRPIVWIGLNPSTADETADDPTIRRICGFSRAWDFGAVLMLNLFAYRATNPRDMMAADDPVGQCNDMWLTEAVRLGCPIVAAWGEGGRFRDRQREFEEKGFMCLGMNKSGAPKHPLYLPADATLEVWRKCR